MHVDNSRSVRNKKIATFSPARIDRYLCGDLNIAPSTAAAIANDRRTLRRVLDFRAPILFGGAK
jgi:hypothetical protein